LAGYLLQGVEASVYHLEQDLTHQTARARHLGEGQRQRREALCVASSRVPEHLERGDDRIGLLAKVEQERRRLLYVRELERCPCRELLEVVEHLFGPILRS